MTFKKNSLVCIRAMRPFYSASALTRTIKSVMLASALVGCALSGRLAQAGLLDLGVDSANSTFSIKVGVSAAIPIVGPLNFTSPALNATLSGLAPLPIPTATTGFLGPVATTGPLPGVPGLLTSEGGGFDFNNFITTLAGPNIPILGGPGSVTFSLLTPHVDIAAGGSFSPTLAISGAGTYDFGGLGLSLNGGSANFSSAGYLSFLGSASIPLITNPINLTLPPGSLGSLILGAGPPNNQLATLTIPLSLTIPVYSLGNSTLGATINAIVSGNLVLTGVSVPEPGSVVLLGVGLIAMTPLIVRRYRRR